MSSLSIHRSMLILLILLLQTVPYLLCGLKINPPPKVGATTPRNNQQPQDSHRMNNVPGNFYVDQSTCYDCDVCRWMCPQVFDRKGLSAVVYQQPSNDDEKLKALSAMLACPVNAIRTETPEPLVKVAMQIFPTFINQKSIPNVLHLGYHAANSYGATPYLLKRKRGNVMIDCPRYNSRLATKLDALGGINTMIITHWHNSADHAKWKKRFPEMQRVIHKVDVSSSTKDVEVQLICNREFFKLDDDVWLLHTPGHTLGSLCLFAETYDDDGRQGDSVLFSGDHVAYRPAYEIKKMKELEQQHKGSRLTGFKAFNRGGIEAQLESLVELLDVKWPFQWILPAHGRMVCFNSIEEKNDRIRDMIDFFEKEKQSRGYLNLHVIDPVG